jgi:pyruvate dehydrogenase E1 component
VLASGVGLPWALDAQQMLGERWGVDVDVWSVTSWNELRRDAVECEEANLLTPGEPSRVPYVTSKLADAPGPVIAVSDYMRAVPDQISRWVPGEYTSLGTDGFGFADTRGAARRFFHVDAESVVVAVLEQLARTGEVKPELAREALEQYQLHDVNAAGHGTIGGDA